MSNFVKFQIENSGGIVIEIQEYKGREKCSLGRSRRRWITPSFPGS